MIDPAEYQICKRRGHDGGLLGLSEKWSQCKWCGVWLRSVKVIEEREEEPPKADRNPLDKYM